MPLNAATLDLKIAWQQASLNPGTNPTTQVGSVASSLAGLDTSEWDELAFEQYLLSATWPQEEINLQLLADLVSCEPFALERCLLIFLKNLGDVDGAGDGVVRLTRGLTNPCDLMFGTTTSAIDLHPGETFLWSGDASGSGRVIGPTNSDILVSLESGSDTFIELVILGSTKVTG